MKRRKFIRTLGLGGIGLYFLPAFLSKKAKAFTPDELNFIPAANRLHGSPYKGCSTSTLSSEFFGSIENGLEDWANFRFKS
ncbi:MAG: hypothetical protein OEV55_06190 [candidate division Zixibacteria bacterium]|nr:hypothetical protein [candidate division Zixibacteria bacterium]